MYERFTDRARKVMQLANQEAQRFNHEYVGTEHVLLGLIKEGSGVAATVLRNMDVDLRKIRNEIEKIVQAGPEMVTMGKLPQTPRAKKVIEYAIEEARTRDGKHAQAALLHAHEDKDEEGPVRDDRLRLIFTCCHPALGTAARVALTLGCSAGYHGRDRARVSGAGADHGPAAGPGQGQDPGRGDPLPDPGGGRPARADLGRARRRLPHLQRGLHGKFG